jgi:hypothetical protein
MDFATATTQPAADSVESDCNPTQARRGKAGQGTARQAWRGTARRGAAGRGVAGEAWQGEARHGLAGKAQTAAIERGISGSQTSNKNRK